MDVNTMNSRDCLCFANFWNVFQLKRDIYSRQFRFLCSWFWKNLVNLIFFSNLPKMIMIYILWKFAIDLLEEDSKDMHPF